MCVQFLISRKGNNTHSVGTRNLSPPLLILPATGQKIPFPYLDAVLALARSSSDPAPHWLAYAQRPLSLAICYLADRPTDRPPPPLPKGLSSELYHVSVHYACIGATQQQLAEEGECTHLENTETDVSVCVCVSITRLPCSRKFAIGSTEGPKKFSLPAKNPNKNVTCLRIVALSLCGLCWRLC